MILAIFVTIWRSYKLPLLEISVPPTFWEISSFIPLSSYVVVCSCSTAIGTASAIWFIKETSNSSHSLLSCLYTVLLVFSFVYVNFNVSVLFTVIDLFKCIVTGITTFVPFTNELCSYVFCSPFNFNFKTLFSPLFSTSHFSISNVLSLYINEGVPIITSSMSFGISIDITGFLNKLYFESSAFKFAIITTSFWTLFTNVFLSKVIPMFDIASFIWTVFNSVALYTFFNSVFTVSSSFVEEIKL